MNSSAVCASDPARVCPPMNDAARNTERKEWRTC